MTDHGDGWAHAAALARFRGDFPVAPLTARRVAGLLDVPGCVRRQVLDAATVATDRLAGLLGRPPTGASPFAHARARQFERRVVEPAMSELLPLVRDRLGAPVTAVRQHDLSAQQVRSEYARADPDFRAVLARQELARMLAGDGTAVNLLRHPVLTLDVGGAPIFLEPDVLCYTATDPLHPVAIRSYPCVDGVADEHKVSATAREIAVGVVATTELATRLGYDAARVGTTGLLVLPQDSGLRPTGAAVDVAPQVRRLRRALETFPDPATLERHLPEGVQLPALPGREAPETAWAAAAAQAVEAVGALPPRFGDGCLSCPLFAHCRAEVGAQQAVARTGTAAATLCGDVSTVDQALALAHDRRTPATAAEQAVAEDLGRAAAAVAWTGSDP